MSPLGLAQAPSLERQGHSIRVMVTRPEREAKVWADALQARGIDCDIMPLIQIAALSETSVLASVWAGVPSHLALMFVSANAVRFFMAARPSGQPMPTCRAWSTGPGTESALLAAGWPAELIDSPDAHSPQFDSEALWHKVAARVDAAVQQGQSKQPSVLIVRGADAHGQLAGRDWLAQQLAVAGLEVCQTVAYARQAPPPEWGAATTHWAGLCRGGLVVVQQFRSGTASSGILPRFALEPSPRFCNASPHRPTLASGRMGMCADRACRS